MRTPMSVDSPTSHELQILRDRSRATSVVYEYLIETAGIGIAEQWLDALGRERGTDLWSRAVRPKSPTNGWILFATPQSERVAKRDHPQPSAALLELSRRALKEAKERDVKARKL